MLLPIKIASNFYTEESLQHLQYTNKAQRKDTPNFYNVMCGALPS